jgi:hypothetical protein
MRKRCFMLTFCKIDPARRRSFFLDAEPSLHQPRRRFFLAYETDEGVAAFPAICPGDPGYPLRHLAKFPPDHAALCPA